MLNMLAFLQNFVVQTLRRDDRGVTSVEYALLLVMIATVLIVAVLGFGGVLSGIFSGFKF